MVPGERFNSITHLVGASLALIGTIALITVSAWQQDVTKILAFSVYGTMLTLLYVTSTLYHSLQGRAKLIFRELDHASIYLLIAGTYTPFALITLKGTWGWTILGIVWGLAAIGIAQDLLLRLKVRVLGVVIALLMGWLIVVAWSPLVAAMPAAGIGWIIAGGVFYTVGVAFYALSKRWALGHAIWHVFVLFGSIAHYVALFGFVALKS